MKKVVILAAAALTLASCAKTYELQETAQPKIGFDTWANNLTKARTQGTSTFVAGDDFDVYGYKAMSDNTSATNVFEGVKVSTTDGNVWSYDTPRFWDSNYDKYTFFAVSPADLITKAAAYAQTGAFSSATITFAGDDNDILVANKKEVLKGEAPYFSNYATVPLVFNHVASLVDIKVKKTPALKNANVSVTAFQLSNIENKGKLSISYGTDSKPVADWTNEGTGTYGSGTLSSAITVDEDNTFNPAEPTTPGASSEIISNLIVKPQGFTTQKITISYQIAITGGDTMVFTDKDILLTAFDDKNDADNDDTEIGSWEPGKHYTFYITIDAHAITFSATISDWDTVSGYNYLVY